MGELLASKLIIHTAKKKILTAAFFKKNIMLILMLFEFFGFIPRSTGVDGLILLFMD